jgi:DNA-binding MarR family transcriptional regulator
MAVSATPAMPTSRRPATAPRPHRPQDDLVGRGMAQWRAERPDIDSDGKGVVGRLLCLEDVVLAAANRALAPHGLKYVEYAVLATLRVSGAPYRMAPSQLQATLLFTSGGLSNLLKRLELAGWVRRSADPSDGRGVLVGLTAQGRRLADAAMPDHAAAERALLQMFDARECEQLAGLLSRMMVGNRPGLGGQGE